MNPYEMVHHNARIAREQHEWRKKTKPDPDWYADPSLWQERKHHDDKMRPVETLALDYIYVLARVASGQYRTVLSEIENEILDTMSQFKKLRSGYPEIHYIIQTALRLKMPVFQVRSILADIEHVKRHYAALEAVLEGTVLPKAG